MKSDLLIDSLKVGQILPFKDTEYIATMILIAAVTFVTISVLITIMAKDPKDVKFVRKYWGFTSIILCVILSTLSISKFTRQDYHYEKYLLIKCDKCKELTILKDNRSTVDDICEKDGGYKSYRVIVCRVYNGISADFNNIVFENYVDFEGN